MSCRKAISTQRLVTENMLLQPETPVFRTSLACFNANDMVSSDVEANFAIHSMRLIFLHHQRGLDASFFRVLLVYSFPEFV